MIYLFFSTVCLLCILSFLICGQDILSPWFITCAAYTVSAFVLALNYDKWDMPFQIDTMFIIIMGICAFGLGEIFARSRLFKGKNTSQAHTSQSILQRMDIRVNGIAIFFSCVIMLLTDIWDLRDTYRISLLAGNPGGYSLMLAYVRNITMYTTIDVGTPFVLKQLKYFCFALAFFFVFLLIYDKVYKKYKFKVMYAIPVLLYTAQMILTTGRLVFLRAIVFIIIVSIILLRKQINFKAKVPFRYIAYAALGAILFIFIFRFAGVLTGKSSRFSFLDNISLYIAGSLPAFDSFIHSAHMGSTSFGAETLVNFQRVFYKLGLISDYNITSLEFINVYGMNFNTYTSLRRYIHDFGFFGMACIQFFLGWFYTRLYIHSARSEKSYLAIMIYGIVFFPIVLQQSEDQFFLSVLSTATFCELLYLACIYWWFVIRKSHADLVKQKGIRKDTYE